MNIKFIEIYNIEQHNDYICKLQEKSTYKEKDMVKCECGSEILPGTQTYHFETRKHQNFLCPSWLPK